LTQATSTAVLPRLPFAATRVWRSLAVIALAAIGLRLVAYAWFATPYGGLVQAMCKFDCGWYERIALFGYGADADWGEFGSIPHWAFFPLYPLAVSFAHDLLGLSARLTGMLLSSLFLCGLVVIGAKYLKVTRRVFRPVLWLIVALLFPYSFFFSAVYTEALFAMLSAGSLLALHRHRPLLAGVLAGLTSATRPTGILLTPVIVVERLRALWRGRYRQDRVALLAETLLPIAVAPLGLFLYMLDQYTRIGDAMAFSHVQVLWGRSWGNPLERLWTGIASWDFSLLLAVHSNAYAASFAVVGLAAAAWLARRRRGAEAWFLAGCILLPASSGLDSLPRFVAANPVFLYVVYDVSMLLIGRHAQPVMLAAVAAVLGALQVTLLLAWYGGAGAVF
jgi:Gpi18-like mannosyltransferase